MTTTTLVIHCSGTIRISMTRSLVSLKDLGLYDN